MEVISWTIPIPRAILTAGLRVAMKLCCGLVPLLAVASTAANEADSFRDVIAPILQRRCLSCHDDQQHNGGLSMQSAESLRKGGESGAAIEPGAAEASYLLDLITPVDGRAEMPKNADPLKANEIEAIGRWIQDGAEWPADLRLEQPKVADRDWWSWQPLNRPPLPLLSPEEAAWVRNPLDAFIRARQTAEGLRPSPEADRRTLLRRLYFDLIGLPPAPADVERFLSDPDPMAYEKLVDRLLASPGYGERWARHWLDVVHYADTHGYDKDKLRVNAWPYRDYVIRSLNSDKDYTRFVREQIAGDVLYPGTRDGIVATGFIAAGPWDFIGHAEVPESKLDGQVARNLDRDDMVTTTINVFCSSTVQCARCHNHKFDPITQEHYYSMQAIFAALDRADRPYDADPQVAAQRGELQQELAAAEADRKSLAQRIQAKKPKSVIELEQTIERLTKKLQSASDFADIPRSPAFGYHSQTAPAADVAKWVQVDLGRSRPLDQVLLQGANEYGFADFGFPFRFQVQASDDPRMQKAHLLLDATAADYPRTGSQPVAIPAGGVSARYIRVTATKLWERRQSGGAGDGNWIFALGELTVISEDGVAPVAEVTSLDSIEAPPRWSRVNLVDGVHGSHTLDDQVPSAQAASKSNGYHSQFASSADVEKWVQLDLGQTHLVEQLRLLPAFPTDFADTPGFGFPLRFRLELAQQADFSDAALVADYTQSDFARPGNRPVQFAFPPRPARYVRLVATKLWDRGGNMHALALAELEVLGDGQNLANQAEVTASDSIDSGRWHLRNLVDGQTSRRVLANEPDALLARAGPVAERQGLEQARGELDRRMRTVIGEEWLSKNQQLDQQIAQLKQELAQLPAPQSVFVGTVHMGSGAFRGRGGLGPREIHLLLRGDVNTPGQLVGPGVFPAIASQDWRLSLPAGHAEGERRAALARWLTDPQHPLTWRSIVNRLWLYHFGRGLVDTPNDFGRMGQSPTHPQLLDWLAVEFRDGGSGAAQSWKSIHRLIVTSAAYRQVATDDPARARIDAGNRFLWRMNRRRLDAESIRDTALLVSGKLNRRMYGEAFRDFVLQHPEHSPHYEYALHDPEDPLTHRRSVYRFLVRSQQQPFMETLDCADPSRMVAKRDETQTALQALTLMNNKFVLRMADHFAARLQQQAATLPEQLDLGFRVTISRSPTPTEAEELRLYAQRYGLANACRLILNLNEFVFVD